MEALEDAAATADTTAANIGVVLDSIKTEIMMMMGVIKGGPEYHAVKLMANTRYVGAAVMKSSNFITPTNVMERFRQVFYTEGDPILATGMTTHSIELDSNRPVYEKPRRYPQAQAAVIEEEGLDKGYWTNSWRDLIQKPYRCKWMIYSSSVSPSRNTVGTWVNFFEDCRNSG
ncbi:hypothetical protein AAG570_006237 [Ranatra chinensis]|uniref:Uncharacterized protein n=1 Tax=Ranatra chinensis TaxID=642074 RepID=A0ABD0YU18_9HEMI